MESAAVGVAWRMLSRRRYGDANGVRSRRRPSPVCSPGAKKLSQNCGTPAPGRANWPQSTAEGGCATRKGRSEIVS